VAAALGHPRAADAGEDGARLLPVGPPVRRLAPTRCGASARPIADLVDSREPQLLAGIVTDLRVVNGQRGRVAIFKLDDGSEAIEAVANEELLDAHRELLPRTSCSSCRASCSPTASPAACA
jgi:DNA polymerase III alpha subunit